MLTIELIKKLADEINHEAFNGELNIKYLNFGISRSKRRLAHVTFRKIYDTFIAKDLKVSSAYSWDLVELKNTIAHELIHIYEAQIEKVEPSHGYLFQREMNRLQGLGYQVEITSSRASIPSQKTILFLLSEDMKNIIFTTKNCVSKIKESRHFSSKFGSFKEGTLPESKIQERYRVARKYKYFYNVSKQDLEKLGI